jgi:phosphomannomutase
LRRYFGTDGVRGVVGADLTSDLVERLGKAATLWSKGGRVFVGRDTRGSGPELEEAFARGVVSAGGNAVLGGVLPTPAVALLSLDLGAVISASHNPPEYNGVKLFDRDGQKLTDRDEEAIEASPRTATWSTSSSASAPTSRACGSQSTARTARIRGSRRRRSRSWAPPSRRSAPTRTGPTSTSGAARPTWRR